LSRNETLSETGPRKGGEHGKARVALRGPEKGQVIMKEKEGCHMKSKEVRPRRLFAELGEEDQREGPSTILKVENWKLPKKVHEIKTIYAVDLASETVTSRTTEKRGRSRVWAKSSREPWGMRSLICV